MHLVIANKLYSSWSLRPWLSMRAFAIPFTETVIPMYMADSRARILEHSPTGKLPVLVDDGVRVWESLAIIEYLAESFPEKAIWPRQRGARAHARAISSEMHAGFQGLRNACPMNLSKSFVVKAWAEPVLTDVARIEAVWHEARADHGVHAARGEAGPFLYGAFSAADAMYAPIVTRLDTYRHAVSAETRAYMEAVLDHPAFVEWRTAALAEPWTIAHYEEGHVPEVDFRSAAAARRTS